MYLSVIGIVDGGGGGGGAGCGGGGDGVGIIGDGAFSTVAALCLHFACVLLLPLLLLLLLAISRSFFSSSSSCLLERSARLELHDVRGLRDWNDDDGALALEQMHTKHHDDDDGQVNSDESAQTAAHTALSRARPRR